MNRKKTILIHSLLISGLMLGMSLAAFSQEAAAPVKASTPAKVMIQSGEPQPSAAVEKEAPPAQVTSTTPEVDPYANVIVAELNRRPIFLREITDITKPFEENMVVVRPEDSRWTAIQRIRERYLQILLNERLFTLAASSDPEVSPTDEEVEAQYQAELKRFGSEENLQAAKRMAPDQVRAGIALSIAVQRLRKKHVIDRIKITPKMKEDYYIEHRDDKFTIPPQAAVRGLFRLADDEIELASEEKKIKEIRAELEEALTGITNKQQRLKVFSTFITSHSEHEPTRFSGGFWYIYGGHHIPKEFWKFEDASFAAPENELSPVTPIDNGYCLFIVDYKRPQYVKTPAEADPEIERILQKELYEKYQKDWQDSLENQFHLKIYGDRLMCDVPQDATGVAKDIPQDATAAGVSK